MDTCHAVLSQDLLKSLVLNCKSKTIFELFTNISIFIKNELPRILKICPFAAKVYIFAQNDHMY